MKDKIIIGVISGVVGSVVKDTLGIVGHALFNLEPVYVNYALVLIMSKSHGSISDLITAIIVEIIFGIILATMYAHIKHLIVSDNDLLKGAGFSLFVWFCIRAAVTIGHVPELPKANAATSLFNIMVAIIFGTVIAYLVKRLESKKAPP